MREQDSTSSKVRTKRIQPSNIQDRNSAKINLPKEKPQKENPSLSNTRTRRSAKQPISYAESSLISKIRKGHVFYPKKE